MKITINDKQDQMNIVLNLLIVCFDNAERMITAATAENIKVVAFLATVLTTLVINPELL